MTIELTSTDYDTLDGDTPVGHAEIARLLCVTVNTVRYWRSTPSRQFPPMQPTPCSGWPWWRWGDVKAWNEGARVERNRKPTADDLKEAS